jgi:shikimate 5-dehydrogenase
MVPTNTPSPLIAEARARGLITFDGWQVMAAQAVPQFQRMTGVALPRSAALELRGLSPH